MNNLGTMSVHYGMQSMALPVRYIHTKKPESKIKIKNPISFVPNTTRTYKILPNTQSIIPIFYITDIKPVFKTTHLKKRPYATPRQIRNTRACKNVLQQNQSTVTDYYAIQKAINLEQLVAEYEQENLLRWCYKPNMSAEDISAMKLIAITELYDKQNERNCDIYECNRDMIHYFNILEQNLIRAWATHVAKKTRAYKKLLRNSQKTI